MATPSAPDEPLTALHRLHELLAEPQRWQQQDVRSLLAEPRLELTAAPKRRHFYLWPTGVAPVPSDDLHPLEPLE